METRGYETGPEIVRIGAYTVVRGRRTHDNHAVLLKIPASPAAGAEDVEALERESRLLQTLSIVGVPAVLEFFRTADSACLVLGDRGLVPLGTRMESRRTDLAWFFRFSSALCATLGDVHREHVIQGGITPAGILVSANGSNLDLIDFSLASSDSSAPGSASPAAGHAAYLSPEQTGRTNRVVDHRADLYSLGATLYELLTGAPPFRSSDPLELVHSHIARTPVPPDLAAPGIPSQVSRIVMRLLAKAAEDRYQSAAGVGHDLAACEREWFATGRVSFFDLGRRDVSERFTIPQRLYGRDRELAELKAAFDESCDGRTALLLVAGYSGIGKSSLIGELYRPIVRQRGLFLTGKFDQVARNIPYGAIVEAFRALVSQLLTQSEKQLAEWRARLSAAVGTHGGVLAEVLPEIQLVLGPQPAPPPLDPAEAQNRFRYVFQSFVGAIAQKDHPLVLFLDDLQWVDPATLDLLHAVLTASNIQHLLVIGAYRDNEVDAAHPLQLATERLEAAGARLRRLTLGPLTLADLTAFLCETLRSTPDEAEPLASLILERTDGNPFFVIQFLTALQQNGQFRFDRSLGTWRFRLDEIAAAETTDNVIDLMTRKVRGLSEGAQTVLTLAACIGNRFEWETLTTVSPQAADEAA
ncbi:MAG TPA: AAA family ATPase, partial [Vicinamibacterales bacterium]|nr:AAA family ATPase [Vicinamibacterales bacterium]